MRCSSHTPGRQVSSTNRSSGRDDFHVVPIFWLLTISVLLDGWRTVHAHAAILLPIPTGEHRLTRTPAKPADLSLPVNATEDLRSNMARINHP